MRALAPHLWPAGDRGIRARVVVALACLTVAKRATGYVPLLFPTLVDLFSNPANLPVVLPLGLIAGYGGLRIASIAFAELRDAVFAKVAQRAIRTVALDTFRHLHSLSLAFHLERRTGGLSRAIEYRSSTNSAPIRFTSVSRSAGGSTRRGNRGLPWARVTEPT